MSEELFPELEKIEPPSIEHHLCESYEEFCFRKRQLEEAGYTYFGNTAYLGFDANCFTNADAFMGPILPIIYNTYKTDPSNRLRSLACLCHHRNEKLVTTTGFNIFSGNPVADSKGVFIFTNTTSINFKLPGRKDFVVLETFLQPEERLLLLKIKRQFGELCEKFGTGVQSLERNLWLPDGYVLKTKQETLDRLIDAYDLTKTVPSNTEGKEQAIADMHANIELLIKSIRAEIALPPVKRLAQMMGPLILALSQLISSGSASVLPSITNVDSNVLQNKNTL